MIASDRLHDLRADFVGSSTNAMPLAGAIVWAALGVAALQLPPVTIANAALYVIVAILPLAWAIDRLRGRNLFAGGTGNPLTKLFMLSILMIGLMVPLVIAAARAGGDPAIVVLGMAILAGVIWIPYGWAADDPVGVQHAVGRAIGGYAAYAVAPEALRATAVSAVVVLAYLYSLARMRRRGG